MRALILGGAGALAVVAVAGCGLADRTYRDEHTVAAGVHQIVIDGGSGDVTITGSSTDGTIHVKRVIRYRDRRPGATDTVSGDALTLHTGCGPLCWVDYQVTAPAAVQVSGRSGSGDIAVRDVAAVSLTAGSGRISVRDASGDVAARTGSGDLDLTGIAGAVTAQTGSGDVTGSDLHGGRTSTNTGSGDVTLRLAAAQDVQASTGSGDVRLTVPAGQTWRVTTHTSSGDRQVSVPTDPAAAHTLDVRTGSGDILVQAA